MKEWFDKWSKNELMVAIIGAIVGAIVGAIASGFVTYFVTVITASGNPMIERYFAIDTASTLIDNYLVDMDYVDSSILEVESLDQQFKMIHDVFAEYDNAIREALVNMGQEQSVVREMNRSTMLAKLPNLADEMADKCSDKDELIKQKNQSIDQLNKDKADLQKQVEDYKPCKEAELIGSKLIVDGELMNNSDSVNNAVARVDGNNFYSESFLNTYILEEQIRYDLQENSIVVGNAKPEKVKFSWDDMVSGREGIDVYQMGGGSSFAMAKNSYTEGLVLSESDCCYVQLRGKYSKLKFTYGHVDDTERSDLELKIFAMDDNGETYTQLLKTISLKGEMNPKDVEVSLGYASAIKIVVSGGSWYPRFGLTDIYFYT